MAQILSLTTSKVGQIADPSVNYWLISVNEKLNSKLLFTYCFIFAE